MNLSREADPVWPEWVYPYSAGVVGGLIGGMGVALVGAGYGLISGVGIWLPVNLVAAAALRHLQQQSLGEIARFDGLALGIGLVLHAGVSVAVGAMFSFLLPALPGRPLFWGPVIGPLLWVGASVAALPVINPVMSANLEIISFAIANVSYGLLLGWWIDRTPMVRVSR
ncbi:MAG TPA: hypothetical protein VIH26_01340 [Anaerolineales bacterium]